VLPYDKTLLIVPEKPSDVPEVVTHLVRVGLDDIGGYLEDGLEAWESHGFEIAQLESISVQALSQRLKQPDSKQPFLLDVRTQGEWDGGHIASAHHIHGGLLSERFEEVPRDRPVAIVCGTGYRGSIAASFLQRQGYGNVSNVLGGMSAWKSAGLPLA
jgi:hydroxyacylglutathione hydrolase